MNDLVVDIRDVAHIGHLIAAIAQVAAHQVEHHQKARVTEMTVIVDRHAADIHAHPAGLDRREDFLAARQ